MESPPASDLDLWFGSVDGRGAASLCRLAHDHPLIEALSLLPYRQHCGRQFPRHTETRHLRSHPSGNQLFVRLFIDPATTGMGRGTLEHALESPVVVLIQSPRLYLYLTPAHATIRQLMIGAASGLYRQPKIGPEGSLRSEPKWCIYRRDDLRYSHHPKFRHLEQHLLRFVPPALSDHRFARRSLEHLEFIHLPEEQLRTHPPACVLLLLDPTLPLA